MSQVVLYCKEPAGLKLGPGVTPAECIQFKDGFAVFESDEFPGWESWVKHPGTPHIEVLPPDSDQVAGTASDAVPCPICERTFKSEFGLNGHLKSHAPKG